MDDSFETIAADLEGISLADGIDENPVSASTLIDDDSEEEDNASSSTPTDAGSVSGASALLQPPVAASFLEECSFVLPHFDPDVIQAFVLSKWDHILGPRAVHVWMLQNPEEPASESTLPSNRIAVLDAVHYVVDHSLNASDAGEPCSTGSKCAIYVVPRNNLVSFAVCFQITDKTGANHVAFSLAAVAESKWLDFFTDVQPILQESLQVHAAKFRVHFSLLESDPTRDDWVSSASCSLSDVCEMLSALRSCPIPPWFPDSDGDSKGHAMNLMADKRFFERALTAHLQTGGRSLVIGSHEKGVASMLSILSLFLTKEERSNSAGPTSSRKFFPLMHMQGYLVDPSGLNFIPASTLLESPAPLSVIDMNKTQVRQTALKHVHTKLHLMALKSSLMSLRDSQARPAPLSEMILHLVREGSPLVVNLVKEILKVPPSLWEYVIGLFMREINWRAYALIQIVEDETNWISQDIDVGSAKQPMSKYLQSLVASDRSSSPEDGDFLIILATADKLSPGIFNYVMNKKIPL